MNHEDNQNEILNDRFNRIGLDLGSLCGEFEHYIDDKRDGEFFRVGDKQFDTDYGVDGILWDLRQKFMPANSYEWHDCNQTILAVGKWMRKHDIEETEPTKCDAFFICMCLENEWREEQTALRELKQKQTY